MKVCMLRARNKGKGKGLMDCKSLGDRGIVSLGVLEIKWKDLELVVDYGEIAVLGNDMF